MQSRCRYLQSVPGNDTPSISRIMAMQRTLMHKVGTEVQCTTDFYKSLGLPRDANQDDIRKAHRKLVREYHPDANPGDRSAEERFKEVQYAYEVLSDPERRRRYGERLRAF